MNHIYSRTPNQASRLGLPMKAILHGLSLCLLAMLLAGTNAQANHLPHFIELNLKEASLKSALKEIERQTDYHFVINDSQIRMVQKSVTLTIKTKKIEEVLDQLLSGTHITYRIRKKQITLIPPVSSSLEASASSRGTSFTALGRQGSRFTDEWLFEQDIIVTGTVKDENGNPLPGVSVLVKGTSVGTIADANGNFSINVPSGESILVFSFIGYVLKEVPVNGHNVLSVELASATQSLNECVVVGYGTQEKKDVTGAISAVKAS